MRNLSLRISRGKRLVGWLAAALALTAFRLAAAAQVAAQTTGTLSLTGQRLIASPSMGDPCFAHTVEAATVAARPASPWVDATLKDSHPQSAFLPPLIPQA